MLNRIGSLAAVLVRRRRFERAMADEMQFHIDRYADDLARSGVTRDEAMRRARIEFGSVESFKEEARGARGLRFADELRQDLRYAARQMRRSPVFTAVAVATIALGVGANTAIFGVIDAVMIKTLPVPDAERLVYLNAVGQSGGRFGGPPYPWFERIRAQTSSFLGLAMFAVDQLPVSIDGAPPEQVVGQIASGNYFAILGVRAALGRTLTPDDERLLPPVAVVGYRYWQRRFGGRADVLGTTVRHNDRTFTIVGVTPREFFGTQVGQPIDITFPITIAGFDLLHDAGTWWSTTVARLKPGVSLARAQADAGAVFASLEATATTPAGFSKFNRRLELLSATRGDDRLRGMTSTLVLLLGAVAAVLLIGCANIANLLLVRASARRREMAMRTALGAGRGRLARQVLTESLLLFAVGAVAGGFVAVGVQRMLAGYLATGRNPIELSLGLDGRVLGFAALLTVVAGLLSGIAPALRAGRAGAFTDLRLAGHGTRGGASRISRTLVVVQVAISIVVLVGGGLLVRTLMNLRSIDLGFRADGVVTMSIQPLGSAYEGERVRQTWSEMLRRVREVPGVASASLSVLTPLSGRDRGRRVSIPGLEARPGLDPSVHVNYVSPGFFATMGMSAPHGRDFTAGDDARAPNVALMNAAAAAYYFDGRSPVGTQLAFNPSPTPRATYTIVGVTGDASYRTVREPAPRVVYLPLAQVPDMPSRVTLAVRMRASLPPTLDAVRREVQQVGSDILISDVETLGQQVDRALVKERILSSLVATFGALGLLLAALGLYGVAAYAVLSRTAEIGIRMALGASPAGVRWLMLRESLAMAVLGAAIGAPVSLAVARLMQRLLYGVSPTDPAIIVVCVALLLGVTALAAYLPARRASRIAPVRALAL